MKHLYRILIRGFWLFSIIKWFNRSFGILLGVKFIFSSSDCSKISDLKVGKLTGSNVSLTHQSNFEISEFIECSKNGITLSAWPITNRRSFLFLNIDLGTL